MTRTRFAVLAAIVLSALGATPAAHAGPTSSTTAIASVIGGLIIALNVFLLQQVFFG